jgi:hypothetical protein
MVKKALKYLPTWIAHEFFSGENPEILKEADERKNGMRGKESREAGKRKGRRKQCKGGDDGRDR